MNNFNFNSAMALAADAAPLTEADMMSDAVADLIEKVRASGFEPSPYQVDIYRFIAEHTGNLQVEAVAGAGKSTTMVLAASLMKGNVYMAAYNKHAGDDLNAKLREQGVGPNVRAGTFHSAGYSTLRYARKGQNIQISGYKMSDIFLNKYCQGSRKHSKAMLMPFVTAAASMAKQRAIGAPGHAPIEDNEAWKRMIDKYDIRRQLPEEVKLPFDKLLGMAQTLLRLSNEVRDVIDFDDMIYQPLVDGLYPYQQDWLVIDEAQDTNPARRALAMRMLKKEGRLVAVGDSRQAIYGFTGADNDSLERIRNTFQCEQLPLTVSYRCPKAVVKHAQNWVSHIESHEDAPEGEVKSISAEEFMNMAHSGELTGKDAGICRYNKPLVKTALSLIREGIAAKIEGKEIGEQLVKLATRWKRVQYMPALKDQLKTLHAKELTKSMETGKVESYDRLRDVIETLHVLADRAHELGYDKEGLVKMIRSMFENNVKGVFTLCSVHKSKGLEWDRVFLIDREEYMPAPFATQPWQRVQEENLIYVGVTRAKKILIEVNGLGDPIKSKPKKDVATESV